MTKHEWHHVPKKDPLTIGERIAQFLGIEQPPTITFRSVPAAGAIAYSFPPTYSLIASRQAKSLGVDYSIPKTVEAQIEDIKSVERPEMMSPAIRAVELFREINEVTGIIVTPNVIIVGGGNPEDHISALNGVAHEHSMFFGKATIVAEEVE